LADIFVSYASKDRELVRSLVESLEMQNWSVWWDRQLTPGEGFADEIDGEILAARCVVVIWSASSVESRWVKSEALEAMERDILVPIKIEDVRIPVAFKQIQTVNLIGWPDPQQKEDYPALMKAVAELVGSKSDVAGPDENVTSICVRPFQYQSHDKEHEFLADGITEDLITSLAHVDDMFVVAQNTSFSFKDDKSDSLDIARELGVRFVLEGSVRPMGQRIRVTARLIELANNGPVWADNFDQPLDDFYSLQDELIEGIVQRMGWSIRSLEQEKARKLPAEELSARGLLLKAESLALIPASRAERFSLVERAIAIAPEYPLALVDKALFLGAGTSNMRSTDIKADQQEIGVLSRQAIILANDSALVFALLGMANGLAGLYDEAIEYLEQAQEIAPNLPVAFSALGYSYIMSQKDVEKGITLVEEGLRRDPMDPRAYTKYQWKALGLASLGRFDEAIESIRKSIRRYPLYPWAWLNLSIWLLRIHKSDEARQALAQARRIHPELTLAGIEASTTVTSGAEVAKRIVNRLQDLWD